MGMERYDAIRTILVRGRWLVRLTVIFQDSEWKINELERKAKGNAVEVEVGKGDEKAEGKET